MAGTFIFLMVAIIFLCIVLILIILSQNPKGGGLSSTFGGNAGSQMFGVQRTNEFMDRATWTLSGTIIAIIAIASILMIPKESIEKKEEVKTEQKAESLPTQKKAPTSPIKPTQK